MTAPQKPTIELLPQEEWEKSSIGRFLKWTLNVGRYIVIATELIVVLAFLSRFKLDRDLTNLYEEIKEKQTIIEANNNFEQKFRFLQNRLIAVEKIEQQQPVSAGVIEELSRLIPQDVALSELSFNGQEINLAATALSEQGLASFLNNLKTSSVFERAILSSVSTGTEKGIGIQFKLRSRVLLGEKTGASQ